MTEYDRPDDMTEWVPEVGDKAVILGRSARGVASYYNDVTVERLTKTQIVTSDGSRFRREKRLGEYERHQARDAWAVPSILVSEDSTKARKARVATAAARIRAVAAKASLTSIASVDDLAAMLAEQRRLIEQSQQR